MTDGKSAEHSLPIWLTLSGTQCSSQHNTASCAQLQSTDTYTSHTLIKYTAKEQKYTSLWIIVKLQYPSCVCVLVSINVCGWVCNLWVSSEQSWVKPLRGEAAAAAARVGFIFTLNPGSVWSIWNTAPNPGYSLWPRALHGCSIKPRTNCESLILH